MSNPFDWSSLVAPHGEHLTNAVLREVIAATEAEPKDPVFWGMLFDKQSGLLKHRHSILHAFGNGWMLMVDTFGGNGERSGQKMIPRSEYGRLVLWRDAECWENSFQLYKQLVQQVQQVPGSGGDDAQ